MAQTGSRMTRRAVLAGSGVVAIGAGTAVILGAGTRGSVGARAGQNELVLEAGKTLASLMGERLPQVPVWGYNGLVPGPEIRVRQGQPFKALLKNNLDEGTTIHWHGLRVPNAMDGVPHLTQDPVEPGQAFLYEFTPADAGTFWYHPHQRSFEQVGRGLYGPLIIEEADSPRVDRDITWVLDDWRMSDSGQISGGFGSRHDAMMAGRIGNTITINAKPPKPLEVRPNERIRLRLVNAANARIFGLDFSDIEPVIIALDGQPVEPHTPASPLLLGPAMRVDLILDLTEAFAIRHEIRDVFYSGLEYSLNELVYAGTPMRSAPLQHAVSLSPNPLAEPNFANSDRHEIRFGGGMMGMMSGRKSGSGMMSGGMMGWTVNGVSATGHVHDPIITTPQGRTLVLDMINDTAWWHPIHLHGHSFRVLSRNGNPTQYREWQDTVLMSPQERVEIAFVADNPGDWMFHCHILEHQAAGMVATIRVN